MRDAATILHVDLDAFYASVEQLADASLRGRPVVVGGLGPRGVVAAASYEARRYGVHSAMPMSQARRACPQAVFLAPRFDAYSESSRRVMAILHAVTPLVEPIAADEAFLDVAGARRTLGDGPEIATVIRRRVRDETGLVASVGVATTKLLAKLASDLAKPDGVLVVQPGTELAFLHPLDVRRLWGVGPATHARLARLGVRTVGDLAALPEDTVVRVLGDAAGHHLHALAHNRDERPVVPERAAKSIGHEETFATDLVDRAALAREVTRMSERVGARLRKAGKVARTVQLKVRYSDFRTITRSLTWADATDLAAEIAAAVHALLDAVELRDGVRLLGVSVQQLEDAVAVQGRLPFDGGEAGHDRGGHDREERRALEHAVDAVRSRFGTDAVGPAVLAGRGGLRIGRRGSLWGPDAGPDADADEYHRDGEHA